MEMVEDLKEEMGDVVYRRSKFVVGEISRIQELVKSLEKNDFENVGKLMTATHYGLSNDYEVSCEELDFLVDQVGTPTYAAHLAKTILDIIPQIENSKVEIYNYSNEGVLSWYDFAKEIMKMAKLNCKIKAIETYQYPTPAKRPHFSLLNKSKIKSKFNLEIPYWKDGLDDCLKRLGERR
jgi:hypothetical protein